jgi:peptide/nickel transport system ATP-binding protein/oligopeptide transport system ATP-binding protein
MSTIASANATPGTTGPEGTELLWVENLAKHYPLRGGLFGRARGLVRAVDGVSFALGHSQTLSLVGESGCGKTTTGRMISRLLEPTSGRITFEGRDIAAVSGAELRALRRSIQIMFQDPQASLSPRMTVQEIIAEPLRIQGLYRDGGRTKVAELLDLVGLPQEYAKRYPHEFSGGQRQRIGLARSLALGPKLLVLDEPVSALDVSVQAQVVNQLDDLQAELGLSYVFISHDLSIVRHVSHRIAVMYLGVIVEEGPAEEIFTDPQHPYTQALLSAVPVAEPDGRETRERITLQGDVPSPVALPSGCRFRTRCPRAQEVCAMEVPVLRPVQSAADISHVTACHFPGPAKGYRREPQNPEQLTEQEAPHG